MPSLPPFRLSPYFRTRIWGFQNLEPWFNYQTDGEPIGEVWLTGEECAAETGPFAGKSLKQITKDHADQVLGPHHVGEEFPLLVKMLFPKEKLSVQVHPDDTMAQRYGEPRGKTECWYALAADPDAAVALGLRPGATPEEIRAAIDEARLEDLMMWLPVHKGDMIYVDAGTVHAIGPGAVILETQQTSDLTYRMYDYGRGRELHLGKSFEAMRMTTEAGLVPPVSEGARTTLIDAPYFRLDRFAVEGVNAGSALAVDGVNPSVLILFVAEGEATIRGDGFETFRIGKCQVAVVPSLPAPWSLDANGPVEILRILPRGKPA
ncbi:MAG TPA: type I phosphomannose isomerase catalytic subunit [Acidisarcina sp.]